MSHADARSKVSEYTSQLISKWRTFIDPMLHEDFPHPTFFEGKLNTTNDIMRSLSNGSKTLAQVHGELITAGSQLKSKLKEVLGDESLPLALRHRNSELHEWFESASEADKLLNSQRGAASEALAPGKP